jgi:hypothetical protein
MRPQMKAHQVPADVDVGMVVELLRKLADLLDERERFGEALQLRRSRSIA